MHPAKAGYSIYLYGVGRDREREGGKEAQRWRLEISGEWRKPWRSSLFSRSVAVITSVSEAHRQCHGVTIERLGSCFSLEGDGRCALSRRLL